MSVPRRSQWLVAGALLSAVSSASVLAADAASTIDACALLDVAQLVWMFENQDGKRGAPRA